MIAQECLVGRALTCMVNAVFPTPPSPSTTSLYSVIFPAIVASKLSSTGAEKKAARDWKRRRLYSDNGRVVRRKVKRQVLHERVAVRDLSRVRQ